MTPAYSDDWLTLYGGDCREVMATLPSDSVDCVVTSPPYWGLRDYGTEGQLGLERTPEEYVANMVNVFREVRRVLKPSGTCWLNLGDSYFAKPKSNYDGKAPGLQSKNYGTGDTTLGYRQSADKFSALMSAGYKSKDLVGIPWRVAFALQADGWYLRSDIIWSKPNPMPESVTDRPTKAHEYLFLLTKSPRYFFDADAVRETMVKGASGSTFTDGKTGVNGMGRVSPMERNDNPAGRNIRSVWTIATRPYPGAHFAVFPPELPERCIKAGSSEKGVCPECGAPWERVVERAAGQVKTERVRNVGGRSDGYTQLPAGGISGHSATTIGWQASCKCRGGTHGDLSERADGAHRAAHQQGGEGHWRLAPNASVRPGVAADPDSMYPGRHSGSDSGEISYGGIGWRPGCHHKPVRDELVAEGLDLDFAGDPLPECDPIPAVILDPFGGSGTVGMVANRLSRRAILIDLNPEYLKQQMQRNAQTPLGLTEGDAA